MPGDDARTAAQHVLLGDGFRVGQCRSVSGLRYLLFQAKNSDGRWSTVMALDQSGSAYLVGGVVASSTMADLGIDPS